MSNHTKGPWTAKEFASPMGTYYVVDGEGHLLVRAGKVIREEDARLVAAAPELLMACKVAELNIASLESCEETSLVLAVLRGAITQAEGK